MTQQEPEHACPILGFAGYPLFPDGDGDATFVGVRGLPARSRASSFSVLMLRSVAAAVRVTPALAVNLGVWRARRGSHEHGHRDDGGAEIGRIDATDRRAGMRDETLSAPNDTDVVAVGPVFVGDEVDWFEVEGQRYAVRSHDPIPRRGATVGQGLGARDPRQPYRLTIRENGAVIDDRPLEDPFIRTTIQPRGWRAALGVLRGRYELRLVLDGTREAHRVVFTGDYSPFERGSDVAAPQEP